MKLMIKKITFTLLLFSAQASFAQGGTLEQCLDFTRKNGDGNGATAVPKECPALIKSVATPLLNRITTGIFAYEGVLYSKEKPKYLYAGSNTMIEEPLSIRKYNKEVFILSKKNGVIVFQDFLPGNVSPIRQLQSTETDFSLDLEADNENLYLLLAGEIIQMDRRANSQRRRKQQRAEIKKRITLSKSGAKAMAMDRDKKHLYILYSTTIIKLDLMTGSQENYMTGPSLSAKSSLEFDKELIIR